MVLVSFADIRISQSPVENSTPTGLLPKVYPSSEQRTMETKAQFSDRAKFSAKNRDLGCSQEFTKGDKPGGLGTEVPSGVQGQNMETLENTNTAVTKIDLW